MWEASKPRRFELLPKKIQIILSSARWQKMQTTQQCGKHCLPWEPLDADQQQCDWNMLVLNHVHGRSWDVIAWTAVTGASGYPLPAKRRSLQCPTIWTNYEQEDGRWVEVCSWDGHQTIINSYTLVIGAWLLLIWWSRRPITLDAADCWTCSCDRTFYAVWGMWN